MREEDQGSHVSRVSHLSRGVPALWTSTSLRAEERLEQISSLLTQERARLVGRLFHAKLSRWLDLWIPVLVAACVLLGIATFYVVQFVHAQENVRGGVGPFPVGEREGGTRSLWNPPLGRRRAPEGTQMEKEKKESA